jgi:hypothetical protein
MITYALKVFMVRTPPMIPVSTPKSMPPKHAYTSLGSAIIEDRQRLTEQASIYTLHP